MIPTILWNNHKPAQNEPEQDSKYRLSNDWASTSNRDFIPLAVVVDSFVDNVANLFKYLFLIWPKGDNPKVLKTEDKIPSLWEYCSTPSLPILP